MTSSPAADELNDAAVASQLRTVLSFIADELPEMAPSVRSQVLSDLVVTLDQLDEDDTFGTEGWRHAAGLDD